VARKASQLTSEQIDALKQAMDAVHCFGDIAVVERSAQRELRRVVYLGPIGRLQNLAFHRGAAQDPDPCHEPQDVPDLAATLLPASATTLLPVINATGVLLHTNLGRAPLSAAA